jgi:hypothetical protein
VIDRHYKSSKRGPADFGGGVGAAAGGQILSILPSARATLPSKPKRSDPSNVCISSTFSLIAVAKWMASDGYLHWVWCRINRRAVIPITSSTTIGQIKDCRSNSSIVLSPSSVSGLALSAHLTLKTSAKVKKDVYMRTSLFSASLHTAEQLLNFPGSWLISARKVQASQ